MAVGKLLFDVLWKTIWLADILDSRKNIRYVKKNGTWSLLVSQFVVTLCHVG